MSWGSGVAVLFCSIFLLFVFKRLLVKLRNTGSQENSKRSCANLMVVLGSGGFHRVLCGFYSEYCGRVCWAFSTHFRVFLQVQGGTRLK